MGRRYYAVRRGREPGVYTSWEQCEKQVSGIAEAEYKTFKLKREAQMYLSEKEPSTALSADNAVYILEYDGASKGNPGRAGAGALLRDSDGVVVKELSLALDTATNNFAEYQGLILGLQGALERNVSRICARGDSKLVCKQVAGEWDVKNERLKLLHAEVRRLSGQFSEFSIQHVRREFNAAADSLANRAISEQLKISVADAGVDRTVSHSRSSDEQHDIRPVKSRTKRRKLSEEPLYLLEYHGVSKGNPGRAGAGALIRDSNGSLIEELSVSLGTAATSFAEYKSLILGLEAALAKKITRIKVSGDSSLVYKQVKGEWAVKSDSLKPLHAEVLVLQKQFTEFSIHHVNRECNRDADVLSHRAVEETVGDVSSVVKRVENEAISKPIQLQHPDEPLYMLEYDGASKGNPGKAGAGALIRNSSGRAVEKLCIGLGETTNNVAEYEGLILGLKAAVARNIARIHASGDSTLVCKQMAGEWVVKNETLKSLHAVALALSQQFVEFSIHQVPREFNSEADALANRGIALPYRTTMVKQGRKGSDESALNPVTKLKSREGAEEVPSLGQGLKIQHTLAPAPTRTRCRLYHSLPNRKAHPLLQPAVPLARHTYFPRSKPTTIAVRKLYPLISLVLNVV